MGIGFSAYTSVLSYYTNNVDSFYFRIPGSQYATIVEYYLAAQDIALPVPKISTLPAGGSGTTPPGSTPPPTRFTYTVTPVSNINTNTEAPKDFNLYVNYPNPFNPSTTIKFDIPFGSFVKLTIYDILGKEVAVLVNNKLNPGQYNIIWNASGFNSGVYFYRISAGDYTSVKKMLLIK
jgi:hypothetical protein